MKKRILTPLLFLAASCAFAQRDSIEAFQRQLSLTAVDSVKTELMLKLGRRYQFIKPDSAIYYFRSALALSEKNGFKKWQQASTQQIARFMMDHGNYGEALRFSNESIQQARELKDTVQLFYSLRLFLWLHVGIGSDSAMKYADSLLLLANAAPINNLPKAADFAEMAYRYKGQLFKSAHKEDSALSYYSQALRFAKKARDPLSLALSARSVGDFYFYKENHDSAFYYYRLCIPIAEQVLRTDLKMACQLGIARLFFKKGSLDSAHIYAGSSFKDAIILQDSSALAEGALLLSTIYKRRGNIDSAYKYLEYAVTLNDLLAEAKKQKDIREVLFKQSLQLQREEQQREQAAQKFRNNLKIYILSGGLALLFLVAFLLYRNSRQKQKDALKIREAYDDLKATQSQLIQSEKMASLGELTAGIAHEIQNPLNFVNNFSELNRELAEELKEELAKGNWQLAKELADNIVANEEKIGHHGKRADGIVKGMLQHSRSSSGAKEPTDINALCDEYLRLAYHGLRAKDKSFNAKFETAFDDNIGNIKVLPQDLGRVILNLINNAFYAVSERNKKEGSGYEPTVMVTTRKREDKVEIGIKDNGTGIPPKVLEKIFQPFFTTKPAGEGTGLGLSLSYDIITKGHGGELTVASREGEGTTFTIQIPV